MKSIGTPAENNLTNEVPRVLLDYQEHLLRELGEILAETIVNHPDSADHIVSGVAIFMDWYRVAKNDTENKANSILWEIARDLDGSVVLALTGNYKHATQILRTALEMVFNFIFFFDHPVELEWWLQGSEESKYRSDLLDSYFFRIRELKAFETDTDLKSEIRLLYKTLSKYVHAQPRAFESIRPEGYDLGRFQQWLDRYLKVVRIGVVLLTLRFPGMSTSLHNKDLVADMIPREWRQKIMDITGDESIFE